MRRTAARRSRFDSVLRSIKDDSVGSWKVLHQSTTFDGSLLTAFEAALADHPAGIRGSGFLKSGPTAHPKGARASVTTRIRRVMEIITAMPQVIRWPNIHDAPLSVTTAMSVNGKRSCDSRLNPAPSR